MDQNIALDWQLFISASNLPCNVKGGFEKFPALGPSDDISDLVGGV